MHAYPFNWLGAVSGHAQADMVSVEVMQKQKLLIILK